MLEWRIVLEVFQTFKLRFLFLLYKPSCKYVSENKELHTHLSSHVKNCTQFGQVQTPRCVTDFSELEMSLLMLSLGIGAEAGEEPWEGKTRSQHWARDLHAKQ